MTIKSYHITKGNKENNMGKLIIDGNSFFEIDEECIRKKRLPQNCGLEKYLNTTDENEKVSLLPRKSDGDIINHIN